LNSRSPAIKGVLFVGLSAAGVVVYLFLLSVFRGQLGPLSRAVPALVLACIALALNWWFLRSEGRSLADIGIDAFSKRLLQAAVGFAAGCILVIIWGVTARLITGNSSHAVASFDFMEAAGQFIFIVFNNAGEELVYRAYLFLLIARSWGSIAAVALTCSLFTLLHIQSGIPVMSAIAGVLTTSLIFAAMFLRWKSVPLVLGFHAATNVMQELLGFRITGLTYWTGPKGISISPSQLTAILAITGVINLGIAVIIFHGIKPRKVI
jgi:membrane protease YdiL (CAAX protease family)